MISQTFTIKPPPQERNLYRVIYVIDINADSNLTAARKAWAIMKDTDSLAPVLDVISQDGTVTQIDLLRF